MASVKTFWIFSLVLLLLASPFVQVARCQSDSDSDEAVDTTTEESNDIGIVGDDVQDFGDATTFPAAPGVDTICVFPKNSARLITAGEETELLVGLKNDGDSSMNVIAIRASVHLPFDHHLLVQNLTAQKTKRAPKVEVGTRSTDASMDEWLEETAYAQSNANK